MSISGNPGTTQASTLRPGNHPAGANHHRPLSIIPEARNEDTFALGNRDNAALSDSHDFNDRDISDADQPALLEDAPAEEPQEEEKTDLENAFQRSFSSDNDLNTRDSIGLRELEDALKADKKNGQHHHKVPFYIPTQELSLSFDADQVQKIPGGKNQKAIVKPAIDKKKPPAVIQQPLNLSVQGHKMTLQSHKNNGFIP